MAETQPGAVPRLKPLDRGQGAEVDRSAGCGNGRKLGETRQWRGDKRGNQERDRANPAKHPFQDTETATYKLPKHGWTSLVFVS